MTSSKDMNFDSPFVKKEKACKICDATDGPMESIFCKADDMNLLNKIYKCTRVEVTPVCGLISPICESCHRRISTFDENALPKVVEFVIKTEPEHEVLEFDPLNVGNQVDPMSLDVKSEDDVDDESVYMGRNVKRKKRNVVNNGTQQGGVKRRPGRPRLNAKVLPAKSRPIRGNENKHGLENGTESEEDRATDQWIRGRGRKPSPDEESLNSSESDSDVGADEALAKAENSDLDGDMNADGRLSTSDEEPRKRGRPRRGCRQKPKKAKKGGSPEQCEVCGKTVSYMREHMRLHRIEKQHPCPHCDRTFVQANNLKYHIRKHLGEKPYACQQCDKHFYCEAHLKSHMRVHGPQGLFQCSMCLKSFNQECNLKKHMRVHTGEKPYGCDTCGKRFNSTSNLRNHARLHSDERPLTCEHCSKSFVDVHHLQRHVRVHTGERPYICHVCSHSYYCQNGLMDHLKTHIEKKVFKLD